MPEANETLVQKNFKMYPSVIDDFRRLMAEAGARTENQFMETLLEVFQNPREKPVPVKTEDQQKEVQELVNEIGRLKTGHTLELEALQTRIAELEAQNNELEETNAAQVTTLEELAAKVAARIDAPAIGENQEIITFDHPLVLKVLDIERGIASKQAKKEVTRSQHLIDTFFMGITNGKSYPYRVWSRAELEKLNKELQTPAQ